MRYFLFYMCKGVRTFVDFTTEVERDSFKRDLFALGVGHVHSCEGVDGNMVSKRDLVEAIDDLAKKCKGRASAIKAGMPGLSAGTAKKIRLAKAELGIE